MALLRKAVILMLLMSSVVLISGQDAADSGSDKTTPCANDQCPVATTPGERVFAAEVVAASTAAPSTAAVQTQTPEPTKAATTVLQTTAPVKATTKVRRPVSYDSDEDISYDDDDVDSNESDAGIIKIWITYVEPSKPKPSKGGKKKPFRKGKKDQTPTKTKLNFPVHHYSNPKAFPFNSSDSLIAVVPWLPIYYDNNTFQTVIFSPSGGVYVMPPLINFYGQRFSVAQLIKWGYASLASDGTAPQANIDLSAYYQPTQSAYYNGLQYDERRGQYTGGVRTGFRQFFPQYNSALFGYAQRK